MTINNLGSFETARRIAFALSLGLEAQQQEQPVIEAQRLPAEPVAPLEDYPGPQEPADADRQRWIQELHLTDEEKRDQAAIRETREASLESYAGSAAEQGLRRCELL